MSSRIKPYKECTKEWGYIHYGRCVKMHGLDSDVIRMWNYNTKQHEPIIAHRNRFDGVIARW